MKIDFSVNESTVKKFSTVIQRTVLDFAAKDIGFYKPCAEEQAIKNFAAENADQYKAFVVLGIGGSALGTRALRDALQTDFSKKLFILDTLDSQSILEVESQIELEKTLFITISKSGRTMETMALFDYFSSKFRKKDIPLKQNFVAITGPTGLLHDICEAEDLPRFWVPENVGGRFSVLTAVGLLPAALIGIDIEKILDGAQQMASHLLCQDFAKNQPFQLASQMFTHFQNGQKTVVLMPYIAKLKTFTEWFVQLLAESTGKNNDGLTPIPALGPIDQHSQLQLFLDGPTDKQVWFIGQSHRDSHITTQTLHHYDKFSYLRGHSFQHIINAQLQATAQSLTEKARPNHIIQIEALDETTLGALIILFEGAVAFLGEFLEVNAFNQPAVERGKLLTKEVLRD
ncbi:glucose-6-phosphate isomerase [bacterium DOLZORAL124_38_8]|nr:MAG: glucose-6-phosphate isomerase [bacterium DOLZORAL124_38_8]